MLIDTHAHINFNAFKNDAKNVIDYSLNNKTWMILVGSEYKTSLRGLNYASKYKQGVYSAIGLHPIHLEDIIVKDENSGYNFKTRAEKFNYNEYKKLAQAEKVVAIGEIGLDYYHIDQGKNVINTKKKQQEIFSQQLVLAKDIKLPVIIHCREAHDDMLMILKKFREKYHNIIQANKPWGVMHCFSGDESLAKEYFSLGLIVSFTGLITFSSQWDNLINKMPLEKLLIETDCPYMTPEPHRGKRNEPIFVKYVAEKIAGIKNLDIAQIAKITTKNAKELFKI
ncbi:TatD family hydrolase [Patescibacteria group bacterium]|nr:TatD family hydrolase [Patescibacteria group bacterium]MBU2415894.1 TatD family hydrolase [Patescibacteria group bacterium]